jgi:hypothetical protein
MSLNFGIYWASATEGYSIPEHTIDSDDPNELYETGYRKIYKPFPDQHPDDQKFKEMHKKFFADGPKLKFIPSEKPTGSLYGYLYYMGDKGVGYYIDHLIMRHVYYK